MPEPNRLLGLAMVSLLAASILGCGASGAEEKGVSQEASTAAGAASSQDLHDVTDPEMIGPLLKPATGDWDSILKSRVIRVLVVSNRTNYFIDHGRARGVTADILLEWEKQLNKELKLGSRPMRIAAIPVSRDKLIPFLAQGRADLAAANLTVTPDRAAQVVFSTPAYSDVSELVVTHKGGPQISQLTDLAGLEVHVRASSSYFESLNNLNEVLVDKGLAPIKIKAAPEYLETEDLLEMVNARLIPVTIADDYLAKFWHQVYADLAFQDDVAIATGRDGAWGIRKDAPEFKKRVDAFVKANKRGTLIGNMLINRYFKTAEYVKRAADKQARQRFLEMLDLFQKYGEEFDFDALMLAAQGYQESGLDQSVRSRVGAVGVMQVMPSTAADKSVNVLNIEVLENNIHAGSKYMRYVANTYFNEPEIDPLNQMLLSFAGYNAGPNRINRLRAEAKAAGYDPNIWFDNVEVIVANKVGKEPVTYVSNIAKYYVAYKLILEKEELKQKG